MRPADAYIPSIDISIVVGVAADGTEAPRPSYTAQGLKAPKARALPTTLLPGPPIVPRRAVAPARGSPRVRGYASAMTPIETRKPARRWSGGRMVP